MPCNINVTAVNGIVQSGQMTPTSVRVLGTASQCPGGQVLVKVVGASGQQTVPVDANGRFRAELLWPTGSTLQCGQTVTVQVECVGLPACFVNVQRVLECCQFTQLYFQAVSAVGALTQSAIQVSGTLLGCASDSVMIGSSVTATVGPIAVDPLTGAFNVQIPTTTPVQCDDKVSIIASCGGSSGCSLRVDGALACTTCYRAAVTVDTSAPCTGTPPVKPVTLTASIAVAGASTQDFHWQFGDGSVGPTFTINNSAGSAATVHVRAETHDYAPGTYTATLKINPPPYECAELQVAVVVQCATSGCPSVTIDPPQIAQSCVNGKRTVTLTSHTTASAGPAVFEQWDFGDGAVGGGIVVNGGATLTTTQTHDYLPGNYTASLNVLSPSGCSSQPVSLNVMPCSPPVCTLAVQNVSVQIGACDPATGTRTVTATGTVNNTDPADLYYWQWDSNPAQAGLPASQGTTQQHQYSAPATGQTSYNVTLTVIRNATCVSSFTKTIAIDGCGAPCPQVADIDVTALACASSTSTTRAVDLTAQVSNAAGSTYEWDFGDSSPVVTSTTPTAPRHDYTAPGTYTAKVTAKTPGCADASATKSVPVATCAGGPVDTGGGGLPACAILLWTSLIMMLVGALATIVGCILGNWVPQAGLVVTIVGAVIFGIGAILFLIWWIVCRFLTLCAVILAARTFVMALIAIFAIIAVVIAIVSIFLPSVRACALASAIYGFAWGGILAMLDFIADQRRCLIANPSGGSSSSGSSSSPLTSDSGMQRVRSSDFAYRSTAKAGLGDVVSSITSAIGIRPCSGCQQRAEVLNQRFPLGASSSAGDAWVR